MHSPASCLTILQEPSGQAVPKINRLRKPLGVNFNAFCHAREFCGRWGQGLGSVVLIAGVHFWRLIWPRAIGLPPLVKSRTYAKLIALKDS